MLFLYSFDESSSVQAHLFFLFEFLMICAIIAKAF